MNTLRAALMAIVVTVAVPASAVAHEVASGRLHVHPSAFLPVLTFAAGAVSLGFLGSFLGSLSKARSDRRLRSA